MMETENMTEGLAQLRKDVKFAVDSGALDDQDGVVTMSFFSGRISNALLRGIRAELYGPHLVESKRPLGETRMVNGVRLRDLNRWVANKVQSVDPNFTPPKDVTEWGFLNAGMTTDVLYSALKKWAGAA